MSACRGTPPEMAPRRGRLRLTRRRSLRLDNRPLMSLSLYPSVDQASDANDDQQAAHQPEEPLPAGWEAQVEPGSGVVYWVHMTTGETIFERPTAAAAGGAASAPPPPPPLPPPAAAAAPRAASSPVEQPPEAPPPLPSTQASAAPSAAPVAAISTTALASQTASRMMSSVRTGLFGSPRPSGSPPMPPQARRPTPATVRALSDGQWETVVGGVTAPPAPRARAPSVLGPFVTQLEAQAAARHDAPPLWDEAAACARCGQGFGLVRRRHHCRNCGYAMCDPCGTKWPVRSMPPLFTIGEAASVVDVPGWRDKHVRVCLSCDAASHALRAALLSGDLDAAKRAYAEGAANVNLRSHLPPAGEGQQAQMLPVHLAAAANALPTLRWLVEDEGCALVGGGAMTLGRPPKSVLQVRLSAAECG